MNNIINMLTLKKIIRLLRVYLSIFKYQYLHFFELRYKIIVLFFSTIINSVVDLRGGGSRGSGPPKTPIYTYIII